MSRLFRAGSSNTVVVCASSLAVLVMLLLLTVNLVSNSNRTTEGTRPLQIYCAAGIANPVQRAIEHFNLHSSSQAEIVRVGGSGELIGQVSTEFKTNLTRGADICLTADHLLFEELAASGAILKSLTLASQQPVIAIRTGSEPTFRNLNELLTGQSNPRIGIASSHAAIGALCRKIAEQNGLLEELEKQTRLEAENVMVLAQALVTGNLDAAIIWDTTVEQVNSEHEQPILQVAALADPKGMAAGQVAAGVLTNTKHRKQCDELLQFLSSSPDARRSFEAYGFQVGETSLPEFRTKR